MQTPEIDIAESIFLLERVAYAQPEAGVVGAPRLRQSSALCSGAERQSQNRTQGEASTASALLPFL